MNQKIISLGETMLPSQLYPLARRYFAWRKLLKDAKMISLIQEYYANIDIDSEIAEVLNRLPMCGITMHPYEWGSLFNEDYTAKFEEIDVLHDRDRRLPYTFLDGKRLYFPRSMSDYGIKRSYYGLQEIEQHPQSPHRYLTETFDVENDDIVVDCGVAEGNFGLNIVDRVKKLYLFEPEEIWMEPLHATFAPWGEKVVIVQKYLSNTTNDTNISLDDYFTDKEYPTFLKLDVEGYEERLLCGAENILSSHNIKKVATCTYHYHEDEKKLGDLLRSHGFVTTHSQGYMIVGLDELRPPYLRRGIIRATKN